MKHAAETRVLLFCNEFDSALAIRRVAVRSLVELSLVQVTSLEEFAVQLQGDEVPSLVLLGRRNAAGPSLGEVIEAVQRRAPGIPVVVLGYGDDQSAELGHAMSAIRGGATDYLHQSELDRLPLILERAARDHETGLSNDRLRYEVRQAADQLRESQKLVTIGRLAGSIAHEINNPLESVTNLLFLLGTDDNLSSRARDYLSLAQRELDRVAQIAKQTLNFCRDTPNPVRILPTELIDEVLGLYARRIAEKQIRILREFEAARAIVASPGEMRQVFSNLITNAIEASAKGSELRIRVRDSRHWNGTGARGLRISIADAGSGISREVRRRLGEPFFTTKGQRGTGLGLWVTKSIVRRYGGSLEVSSSTDPDRHGTVFSVFLPASPRAQAVVAINEPHGAAATQAASGGPGLRAFPGSDPGRGAKRHLPEGQGDGEQTG